jgi:hypothetical protein
MAEHFKHGPAEPNEFVADARVEHEVKLMDFTKWLESRADRYARRVIAIGFDRSGGCRWHDNFGRGPGWSDYLNGLNVLEPGFHTFFSSILPSSVGIHLALLLHAHCRSFSAYSQANSASHGTSG